MGGGAPGSLSTLSGVIVPTCENMWGVLIFLRFFFVVGHAGVWQSLVIVFVSFLSSLATTMSLSAMATNGPVQAGGACCLQRCRGTYRRRIGHLQPCAQRAALRGPGGNLQS